MILIATIVMFSGFSGHSDINKALEISLDVKRISNQLKECQSLAQLYNQRERLFGTPVTQYDKVYSLVLFPYSTIEILLRFSMIYHYIYSYTYTYRLLFCHHRSTCSISIVEAGMESLIVQGSSILQLYCSRTWNLKLSLSFNDMILRVIS
jgi:hypothetical protein